MKKTHKAPLGAYILMVLVTATAPAQDEGGGQSGADFLLDAPAARADAMGGVVDGQGNALEGMLYNPSTMMLDPEFYLRVNIVPLPNEVTNSQLTTGIPIVDGMLGASVQFVSLGEFTYINSSGQPQGSVTLYDGAATVGYSQEVLENLSVGASAKAVYRTLGDYSAFAVGTDIGATWWFETPHIGKRPVPPTVEQLEAQRDREQARVDSERDDRVREAAGDLPDLERQVERLTETLGSLETDLAEAEPDADTTRTEERIAETETELAAAREALEQARDESADALAEIESWYARTSAEVEAGHRARLADLREVERERARLFAIVDDPDETLTADDIDRNVQDAIDRTREFVTSQREAIRVDLRALETSREDRVAAIDEQIATYEAQIADVVGPEAARLREEIARLEERIAEIEASDAEDASDQIRPLRSQISENQKAIDELESDTWVRRLRRRIEDKEAEIADITSEIETARQDAEGRIQDLELLAERSIVDFESLNASLNRDLRRAQLRLELDLLEARNERATERANTAHEASEQEIYQTLLAAMYQNEERNFQSRLSAARVASDARRFDASTSLADERAQIEDDFAFSERFLTRRISDLERAEPVDDEAVTEAEAELATLRDDHEQQIDEIDAREGSFDAEETARYEAEVATIRDERQKVRLIYLQTDDPYQNTSITVAIRNLGTNLTFAEAGYPMPRTAALGLSYGVVNTDLHRAMISAEIEMPLYGEPALTDLQIGVGAEYTFAELASFRAGYSFGTIDRSFSLGFGLDFALGFTAYQLDYAFRPLPDYGLVHNIGLAIGF